MFPRKVWNRLENKELDQVVHLLFASSCSWEYESFPPFALLLFTCSSFDKVYCILFAKLIGI